MREKIRLFSKRRASAGAGMRARRNIKIYAAAVLMAAVLSAAPLCREADGYVQKKMPELTAWWGVMYPEFCFAEGVLEEDPREEAEEPRRKFSFWLLKILETALG